MPMFAVGSSHPERGCLHKVVTTISILSEVRFPLELHFFPWKMQWWGQSPLTAAHLHLPHACQPQDAAGGMWLQRELGASPWLQALYSSLILIFFFNHCSD